ncbi:MAG: nucleoside-diphosphate-sugar epimerase [Bacteroidetes bacterium HLUCCA01]|nr:MAG: nucleoside-diphosphate-sugar epimerase [Bacteroidetes bacterium HLUCCA01]
MKAFITGGTGFIGSHLVDRLLADNAGELRCMVRAQERWLTGKSYTRVSAGLHDVDTIAEALEGVDVLFHTAGVVKARDTRTFHQVNVEATENLLRLAMRKGVPKVVILSSQAAAGPSFNKPVEETMPMMPVSRYGESKKRMEEMIHQVAGEGISVSIIRPSSVYGPREEDIYTIFKIAAKGIFPIIGKAPGKPISLVHVRDVVEGSLLAAADRTPGVQTWFISSERGYSWHEIAEATQMALGKKLTKIHVPESWVSRVGTIAETGASFFGKYPVLNRDKAAEMVLSWVCSVEKARIELGYQPSVSLQEGIRETIAWYKTHNWL